MFQKFNGAKFAYRQGIGTNLFKAVLKNIKMSRSFCLLDIHDIRDNEFYKSLGMVKIEEERLFHILDKNKSAV